MNEMNKFWIDFVKDIQSNVCSIVRAKNVQNSNIYLAPLKKSNGQLWKRLINSNCKFGCVSSIFFIDDQFIYKTIFAYYFVEV